MSPCSRRRHRQAISLYKILSEKRAAFAEGSGTEKQFVSTVRTWCESIVANGSGSGKALEQNATVARDFAKSADAISAQVGQVRQAVYDLTVTKDYTQEVRTTLIGQLTKRQRFLQELHMALDDVAKGFDSLGETKGYKGDSYPNAMGKLTTSVQGYRSQNDAVAEALASLTEKYAIKDSELTT